MTSEQPERPDREEPAQPAVPVEPVAPATPEPPTPMAPAEPQVPGEPHRPATPDEPGDDAARGAGDRRVEAALRRLDELGEKPPPEHVPVYEDVHRTLQEVLAEASGRPDAPGHGGGARR